MDLNNISLIIKKINRLYDIINNIGEASDTEKDLLKAYVLDLYESVAIIDGKPKDLEQEEMLRKIKKQKKIEKKLKKQLNKEESPEPVASDESADNTSKENQNGNEAVPEEDKSVLQNEIAPELLELFETTGVSDLSDKLSQKAIPDLSKAMGINERIFTINELFGGDKKEFDNMLTALNGLDNFDEAKKILMNSVANKHNWQSDINYKKAKKFIKLIQRRYN